VDDLFFGVPDAALPRLAKITGKRPPFAFFPPIFLLSRVIPPRLQPGPGLNSLDFVQAAIPAANLTTTARSLARHYAALCEDGIDGVHLRSPERVALATTLQTDGRDRVLFGQRIRKGLGYWLGGVPQTPFGERATVFGHPGSGGLIAFADPEQQLAFALL